MAITHLYSAYSELSMTVNKMTLEQNAMWRSTGWQQEPWLYGHRVIPRLRAAGTHQSILTHHGPLGLLLPYTLTFAACLNWIVWSNGAGVLVGQTSGSDWGSGDEVARPAGSLGHLPDLAVSLGRVLGGPADTLKGPCHAPYHLPTTPEEEWGPPQQAGHSLQVLAPAP